MTGWRPSIDADDDHNVFAARLKQLSGLPRSPINAKKKVAAYMMSPMKRTAGRVDQLISLLDAAGSAIGIPPLPGSPNPRRLGGKLYSERNLPPVSVPKPLVPHWSDGPLVPVLLGECDGPQLVPWKKAPKPTAAPGLRRTRTSHSNRPTNSGIVRSASAATLAPPPKLRPVASVPSLTSQPSAIATPSAHGGASRRAAIATLPSHVRKEVMLLFDAFAMMQNQPTVDPPHVGAKPPTAGAKAAAPTPASRATSLLGMYRGKLVPSKRSFESVLRMNGFKSASQDEVEAMLALVATPLEQLATGQWVENAKRTYGAEVRAAFTRADKDGSGGIDLSEFAIAVEAANVDDTHMRLLFDAADANGDGVLDVNEFLQLVATSSTLRPAFGDILHAAKEKRDRAEFDRLSSLFRNPNALRVALSPSGRRRRPALCDLRSLNELTMPWSKTQTVANVPSTPRRPAGSDDA